MPFGFLEVFCVQVFYTSVDLDTRWGKFFFQVLQDIKNQEKTTQYT